MVLVLQVVTMYNYHPRLLAKSNIEKQNFSHRVNDVCNGSPSRILRVLRISLGMTMRPRSSTLLTMPVAFIISSPLKRGFARFLSGRSICRKWGIMYCYALVSSYLLHAVNGTLCISNSLCQRCCQAIRPESCNFIPLSCQFYAYTLPQNGGRGHCRLSKDARSTTAAMRKHNYQ